MKTLYKKRNIYNILKRSHTINEQQIDIDIGEENEHLLNYSKLNTLINNADIIVKKTDIFIKELEEELKTKSIINPDEPGYLNYIQFQKMKRDLIRQNNINNIKYIFLVLLLLAVIVFILYYVIVDKIDDLLKFKD